VPTNLDGLLVLLLFVLPGFVAVEVNARFQPIRERSAFDKTALSVLFSTLVHLALVPIATYLVIANGALDPRTVDASWLSTQLRSNPVAAELCIGGYFLAATFVGGFLGYLTWILVADVPPVWAAETYVRVQKRTFATRVRERFQKPRYRAGLSVYVIMKNGDRYVGLLKTLTGEFDELQRKDKFFSIQKAVYLGGTRPPFTLPVTQVVLLNTENVDAMWIAEEDLPKSDEPQGPAIARPANETASILPGANPPI